MSPPKSTTDVTARPPGGAARPDLEPQWLRAIRAGRQEAWGTMYEHYAPELYRRVLMPRLGNPSAAEDALSETFRTAIERFDQYQDQGVTFYAWLARIAHNKAMDLHRARAMTGRKLVDLSQSLELMMERGPEPDAVFELVHDSQVVRERIVAALDQLNPRYARAIELRYVQDKPRARCAELMGVKVGTFDVLLLRAVRAFQKVWGQPESES